MDRVKKLIAVILLTAVLATSGTVHALALEEPISDETMETEAVIFDDTEEAEPAPESETAGEEEPEEPGEPDLPEETEEPEDAGEVLDPEEPEASEEPEQAEEADEPGKPEPSDEPEEPAEEEPAPRAWVEPGNTDAEITSGGRYLLTDDALYYSDGGLWTDRNGETRFLCADDGRNLNLCGGQLYYTVGGEVRRIPAQGGAKETVFVFESEIRQLYVMGAELRFLADGCVYSHDTETGRTEWLSAPEGTRALIPTPYGNVYLTGAALDYSVWAGDELLCTGASQCRRDGEYLVLVMDGETMQASLASAFSGGFAMSPYSLHQEMLAGNGLSDEKQLENEAAFLFSEEYAAMQDGLTMNVDGAYTATNSNIAYAAYSSNSITTNQKNIVLRGRQMAEVKWTPLQKRYSWGGDDSSYVSNNQGWGSKVTATDGTTTYGYFVAGKTYEGIPYSQAVYTGFVGWSISIDGFVQAVNDSNSNFYSGYSGYSRTAPYYGTDCSAFVSWAWDLASRCTCTSLLPYSEYIGKSLSSLQIGDCLNNPNSHVVLITNIGYDADGNVVAVEITEETPCKVRVTCYGELFPGKTYQYTGTLSYIERNYFNGGYAIYRRSSSRSVSFKESAAVNLVETGYASAPGISVSVNAAGSAKLVKLTHSVSGAAIYYTTDGTKPSSSSSRYTGPITVTKKTTIRAIAVLGAPYTGSYELKYTVEVTKAEKPSIVLVSGNLQDGYVSSGTKISASNSAGDKIYYTTDGSTPTTSSARMTDSGIQITKDMTLKAIAVSGSALNSETLTVSLKIGQFHTIQASAAEGGSISPAGKVGVLNGTSRTFTIQAHDHFAIEDVQVDGKSVGKVTKYTFTNVTAKHTISVTFAVNLPFKDVKKGWYVEKVAFVWSHELFSGTTSTTFSPNATMTRGMFITVLGRSAGNGSWTDLEKWSGCLGVTAAANINIRAQTNTSDTSVILGTTGSAGAHVKVLAVVPKGLDGGRWYKVTYGSVTGYMRATSNDSSGRTLLRVYNGSFSDLPAGAYYTGYAQWAYAYGLISGVSDTSFAPGQAIKRQDICVMLYRYLTEYLGRSVSSVASTFTDDASISGYARKAVYAMKNIGVVNGYTDGSFKPQGYATRAEVASMFENLYHYLYG